MVKCDCDLCKQRSQDTPYETMLRALKVMVLDKERRAWMEENDPKALEQAEFAIDFAEGTL